MSASKLLSTFMLAGVLSLGGAVGGTGLASGDQGLFGVSSAQAQSSFKRQQRRNGGRISRTSRVRSDVFLRRDQIEQRNRRVAIENQLQFERRQATVFDSPRNVVERNFLRNRNVGFDDGFGTTGGVGNSTPACPVSFNCGFRVYQNGSGPRVIVPGVQPGGDVPQFDGVRGPQIIQVQ